MHACMYVRTYYARTYICWRAYVVHAFEYPPNANPLSSRPDPESDPYFGPSPRTYPFMSIGEADRSAGGPTILDSHSLAEADTIN